MKKSSANWILTSLLAVCLSACAATANPPVLILSPTAVAANPPVNALTTTQTLAPTTYPGSDQVKTVNGIEIQIKNITRANGKLGADICFSMPDNEDWMLRKLSLRYGGSEQTGDWGGRIILPVIPAANGQPGRRCDWIYFNVPDRVDLTELTITVHSISAIPREGMLCARMASMKPKLEALKIRVVCTSGDHHDGFEIAEKPASMSQTDAEALARDVIDLTIQGPWEFAIHLSP